MDDTVILNKKKKLIIDDSEDGPPIMTTVPTKVSEEKIARDNYDHKTNGDKSKEAKKQSDKKEDAKPSKPDPKASPAKPKPTSDKDPKAVKSNTDQKPPVKPKPAASTSEKKASEANGQEQKKAHEEKKAPSKPPQKKKEESESESESEESADETDSEDERRRRKAAKAKKQEKEKEKVKKQDKVKKDEPKVVRKKDVLVYDVLKRWWYALPDWPPTGYDYSAELLKNKLRKVDPKYFRKETDTDANGCRKVFEMPAYPGMFKDSTGEIHDLRPKETCPSFDNFKNKSVLELCQLLATALKNQVEALEKSPVVDEQLLHQLKKEALQAQKSYDFQKNKQQQG